MNTKCSHSSEIMLALKHQAKFAADDVQKFFFISQRKQVLTFHVKQIIHIKYQDLFSLKNNKKKKHK